MAAPVSGSFFARTPRIIPPFNLVQGIIALFSIHKILPEGFQPQAFTAQVIVFVRYSESFVLRFQNWR